MRPALRLPSETERVSVFGRTGSGKTVFLAWLLSKSSISWKPWIILDYKRDGYLRSLPRLEEIDIKSKIPKHPGIYRIVVDFQGDEDDVDRYLFKLLDRGDVGLFCDEGSNIPQREPRYRGLRAVFAQGRSLRVPVLFGTQRPSWINKSVLSESEYFVNFGLQNREDQKRASEFMGDTATRALARYECSWYDVRQGTSYVVSPVSEEEAFDVIEKRLRPRVRIV